MSDTVAPLIGVPLVVAALLLGVVPGSQAQSRLFTGAELFVAGQEGLEGNCLARSTRLGFVMAIARPVSKYFDISGSVRPHIMSAGPSCVDGLFFPPPDGTYEYREPHDLLTRPFVGADLRIRLRAGDLPQSPIFSVGGGLFMRHGSEAPYLIGGIGLPFPLGPTRLTLVGEIQYARLRIDRIERTWQNSQVVSETRLAPLHPWGRVVTVAVGVDAPLGRASSRLRATSESSTVKRNNEP